MICPDCGEMCEDTSVFCQNCGAKLEHIQKSTPPVQMNSQDRIQTMKLFGYLVIFLELVVILGSWFHVKMINADRLMLYPLLCVILAFFCGFKLLENDETIKDSKIVIGVSLILFLVSILV